mgnify:CR=1 FL=1
MKKWDKKKKVWKYPLDSDTFKALTAMFPNAYIVESVKENLRNLYERYKNYSNLKTKAFNTKNHNPPDLNLPLYKHQMISYTYFMDMPYAIDFSECGAGKTATQIALIANHIRNENHHILIICPKSIMTQVWEKDIKEFILGQYREKFEKGEITAKDLQEKIKAVASTSADTENVNHANIYKSINTDVNIKYDGNIVTIENNKKNNEDWFKTELKNNWKR